jgi:hypothetical protein
MNTLQKWKKNLCWGELLIMVHLEKGTLKTYEICIDQKISYFNADRTDHCP